MGNQGDASQGPVLLKPLTTGQEGSGARSLVTPTRTLLTDPIARSLDT